jgi:phosphatidylserine/phosphatidylglycerophosphate/cardiolipin synthase-like enzyme
MRTTLDIAASVAGRRRRLGGAASRPIAAAKCVVADRSVALVTSANFTAAAQQRNFELGLLVRDVSLAGLVWDHFDALIRVGVLRSLHFGAGDAP